MDCSSGHDCDCPNCAGNIDDTHPGLMTVGWGLVQASERPGMSNFWAAAHIADTYERSHGRSQSDPVSRFITSQRRASASSNTADTRYSFAVGRMDADGGAGSGGRTGQFFMAQKCCPDGKPEVKVTVSKDMTNNALPKGLKSRGGGLNIEWDVQIKAKWKPSGKGVDMACSCDCCLFRVFVSFDVDVQNAEGSVDSDVFRKKGGPYHKGAVNDPKDSTKDDAKAHYPAGKETFVEDVTFAYSGKEKNPLDIAEDPGAFQAGKLTVHERPGTEKDPKTTLGACKADWEDTPRIGVPKESKVKVKLTYLAVIRKKSTCAGEGAATKYELTADIDDTGEQPGGKVLYDVQE